MNRRFTAIDIETTGLSPEKERIIEIGAVRFVDGKQEEVFSTLVHPDLPKGYFGSGLDGEAPVLIPRRITELTGITDEMVMTAPKEEEALQGLFAFLSGEEVLLGHNIPFDFSFLKMAALRCEKTFSFLGIDTLPLSRHFLPELEGHSLSALCEQLSIETACSHRAYEDALSAAKLYFLLNDRFFALDEKAFAPKPLFYEPKKQEPMTQKQKNYLYALISSRELSLKPDMNTMTKSEASRMIDRILSGQIR